MIEHHVRQAEPSLTDMYRSVRRLVQIGAIASWLGMWWEVLRPTKGKGTVLFGMPVRTIAVGIRGEADVIPMVVRVDAIRRLAHVITLPPELLVADLDGNVRRLNGAILRATGGDPATAGRHLCALFESITHLPIDGYLVGSRSLLGSVIGPVLFPERDPVRRGRLRSLTAWIVSWPRALRIKASALLGAVHTSDGVPGLASLAWHHAMAEISSANVNNVTERPVSIGLAREVGRPASAIGSVSHAHVADEVSGNRPPWMA
jgi:hypothetical protein